MEKQIKKLNEEFIKIKKMGWIKSVNCGSNGIGFTFESLLGISKNELEIPDYNGIELKTRRYSSTSYIILFSLSVERIVSFLYASFTSSNVAESPP